MQVIYGPRQVDEFRSDSIPGRFQELNVECSTMYPAPFEKLQIQKG
ncbi:MAG: hypothetical protein LAT80_00960 [Balneolaceae bacterium]|nr:hypothetical protein [Balneolaceae bacterium]